MNKRLLTAAIVVASMFASAAVQAQHTKNLKVELIKMQEVTMEGGKTTTVAVVKMNGHVMIGIPEEDIPDPLHRQIFRYGERYYR